MPAAVAKPPKRVLADSTKAHRNVNAKLPSPKRRKLEGGLSPAKPRPSQTAVNGKLGSSQPKSQFEEEVLEKLTQDVSGLKQKNSEKDQHWDRPALEDFDEKTENLCFQQIETEEGTLHGGRTVVKLFGVTEVCQSFEDTRAFYNEPADRPLRAPPCHRFPTLPLYRRSGVFCKTGL